MSPCLEPSTTDAATLTWPTARFHAESLRLLRILDARLASRDYLCGPGRGDLSLTHLV